MASKASLEVSSLLVPSVVELSKELSTSIPSRYLRSDIEKAVVPNGDHVLEIPAIDMQKLLVNHGFDSTLLGNIKAEIDEFFKLPIEEKKKWWKSPGNAEGFGQAFVVSDNQKLDWGDLSV
ncbi:hypothetical protein F3Y22_tig00111342pilonHSYRG00198 [Hibiscus syriacus]|uniref:Non-haem dioxygenase N-terminal domain-containing protein n=1 Tax=Hibiscus syriacus TaxID=106335 RepID=A0A6A2YP32_HIBSY|nr:hypothetical protein F3Y22_tig00111342pilonHSYRG00198 [Hibiscus syriacus]